ncbi:MAG: polyprenol monophosphomannose synthase [Thermodesulfovibrionales bacterium]
MNRSLVIIPTYNERETLSIVIESVLKYEGFDILVVDDGSPDGTAQIVKDLMAGNNRIFLIERSGKLGLGTAYVAGFKWGLEKGYDYFIEMDADGSHDPGELPSFIDAINRGFGLVIGSRYLNGSISVVGWDFRRLMLSKFGNYYASKTLGLKLTDLTSGFRCYSKKALESIDLEKVHSNGYAFQIEMAYRVWAAGHRVGELSIIFSERASGSSKMSKKIVREAVILPWRLRLGRLFAPERSMVPDSSYQVRSAAGFLLIMAGLAGGVRLGWWLSTEGDIVEIIHRAKMGLPDWAWMVMKVGLSALSAALFIVLFLGAAIAVFACTGKK